MERRVVITGIGVVSSIGIGKNQFWDSVVRGATKVSEISDPDIEKLKVRKACIIDDGEIQKIVTGSDQGKSRGSVLSLFTATCALKDSGIDFAGLDNKRIGVVLGTTIGESPAIEQATERFFAQNIHENQSREILAACSPFNLVVAITEKYDFSGPSLLIPAACAAGNYSIGNAYEVIRSGLADVMLAGGVEPYSKVLHIGFARMNVVAPEICQPFDRNRKGLMVGEGAGIIVLEELNRAKKRGAEIYGELLGYGLSCDAHHMAVPEPGGRGAAEALSRALSCAKMNPGDIQYINAHGTGTKANDLAETKAIKKVFGSIAKKVPVSSIKSMIGHTMGAAGAIEAVVCALILKHHIIPPTINYHEPDPQCDLDYVPNYSRNISVRRLVSNSYGFFGNNASIVMAAY